LAGSYYVESLTNEITENAWKLIEEVEELGGMTKAIESGIRNLESKRRPENKRALTDDIIVGVNQYRLWKRRSVTDFGCG
jgi:methylmalonyl-CoA mutase